MPRTLKWRIYPEHPCVYMIVIFVPIVYILLLPAFARANPFGTTTFAAHLTEDDTSISQYVSTAPANGGFAAFSSPIIVYAWLNPITRSSLFVQLGASIFTLGWLLSILLPLHFASAAAHNAAFLIATIGTIVFSFAILTRVQPSCILCALFVGLFSSIIVTLCLSSVPGASFIVFEYITAIIVAFYAPLFVLLGKRRPWCALVDDSRLVPRKS